MGPGPILLLLLFLGPTFLAFLTLIFIGSFFSANSLVSCSKSCTVGQCYYFWRSSSSQHYFFSYLPVLLLFLSLLLRLQPLPKNFPSIGLANSPKSELLSMRAAQLIVQHLFVLLFPQYIKHLFLHTVFLSSF